MEAWLGYRRGRCRGGRHGEAEERGALGSIKISECFAGLAVTRGGETACQDKRLCWGSGVKCNLPVSPRSSRPGVERVGQM